MSLGILFWAVEIYRLEKFTVQFTELSELHRAFDQHVQVIMFGSSVNTYYSKSDTDKRSISEMVDSLTVLKTVGISRGAFHADIYLDFCQYMIRKHRMPQVVVIPINMRSFSPVWDLRPEYQFVRRRRILKGFPYINLNVHSVDYRDFNNTPVYQYQEKVGKVGEYIYHPEMDRIEAVQKGYVLNYLYPLKENHRKLISLRKLADLLTEHEIVPVFYIEPIDYEPAIEIFGNVFKSHVQKNITIIQEALAEYNQKALNLCFAFDHTCFDYEVVPNEHMHQAGRLKVAEVLAEQINQIMN